MSEKNKIAIVTGANKGIGFEITRQLCFKGYTVLMCGRDKTRIEQAAGLLKAEGHSVVAYQVDVSIPEEVARFAAQIESENLKVDALVNNAAVLFDWDLNILEVPYEHALETMKINTLAPLYFTKALIPCLAENARVVMMSSGAGASQEFRDWAPTYSISKLALNRITRHMAMELAKQNIIVSAASPGWVRTDMGGSNADRSVKEGAETPVWLATEVSFNETGNFWRDKKIIPW